MRTIIIKKFPMALLLTLGVVIFMPRLVWASTNISLTDHWAWNDAIGWIDFYVTNTVNVTSQKISGYASSTLGDISLDCATTRNGYICSQSNYSVKNDGSGNLSGWAWNDYLGWISFCGGQGSADCPGSTAYRVLIDSVSGVFSGYGWSDLVGWISFNCSNTGSCTTSTYRVVTSWAASPLTGYLDSSVYDTGVAGGAELNSILWHGSEPSGTTVEFQFAASNSSAGPWVYKGPDGTSNTYYLTGPSASLKVDYALFNNQRYLRYRVTLVSNTGRTLTPRVDDVILNWSP